jgi:hypothetical protein
MNIKNLDVNPKSGTGTASLAVTASPNLATFDKENVVKIQDQYGVVYSVKVSQKAKEEFVATDEDTYIIPAEGGDIQITGSGNIIFNEIHEAYGKDISNSIFSLKEFKWINDVTEEEHIVSSIAEFNEEHLEYGYRFVITLHAEANTDSDERKINFVTTYKQGYSSSLRCNFTVIQYPKTIESITEEVSLTADDTESTIEINTYNENGKWSFAGIE